MATEQELAAPVVEWLQAQHWDVYQEVKTGYSEAIADIVAVLGKLVWVIEVKKTMSLALMEQAYNWKWQAHYVSVVVPKTKRLRGKKGYRLGYPMPLAGRQVFYAMLEHWGIGLVEIDDKPDSRYSNILEEVKRPSLMRKAMTQHLLGSLNEAQKWMAPAGSQRATRYSPFQGTVMALKKYARENPGCMLRDALAGIEHHYATDKSGYAALTHLIFKGVVKGLRIEYEGRRVKLVLDEGGG